MNNLFKHWFFEFGATNLLAGLFVLILTVICAVMAAVGDGLSSTTIAVGGGLAVVVILIATYLNASRQHRSVSLLTEAVKAMSADQPAVALESLASQDNPAGRLAMAIEAAREHFTEKLHWQTAILDAIPFPLSVTDMNMNWTFINKPVESLLGVKRETVMGHTCSEWNANICKTENCGIARLRKNFLTTMFDQAGGHFRVDTSYLYNTKGEKIGHVEAVQDITTLIAGQRYQEVAINSMAGCLFEIAKGNLGFEIADLPKADKNTEEVRRNFEKINTSLIQARDRLSSAMRSVVEHSEKVSLASSQLAAAATQAGQATSQIASTMQQVAKGTSQQSESVTRTAAIIDDVTRTVDGVSKGVANTQEAVKSASQVSELISGSNGIALKVNLSAQKVQEMGDRSKQIGIIVETIEDIASQTNLLALNAAIEAARAGEHGKGFAVVADEVRKLAERASSATKEISGLIRDIQNTVGDAVKITTQASDTMRNVAGDLSTAINSVSSVANENAQAVSRLSSNSTEMIQSIENIASVSEENGAAVEEVSASAEEMSAQVQEVTAAAQALADLSEGLQQAVAQFNLANAAVNSPVSRRSSVYAN
ncbi:MAG: PAS domain-containing protein [Anaerolineae bacterium]|nr:PAS domain-containing protein [Anaerolineae bacterium]